MFDLLDFLLFTIIHGLLYTDTYNHIYRVPFVIILREQIILNKYFCIFLFLPGNPWQI